LRSCDFADEAPPAVDRKATSVAPHPSKGGFPLCSGFSPGSVGAESKGDFLLVRRFLRARLGLLGPAGRRYRRCAPLLVKRPELVGGGHLRANAFPAAFAGAMFGAVYGRPPVGGGGVESLREVSMGRHIAINRHNVAAP
jgi:hypothetical protein